MYKMKSFEEKVYSVVRKIKKGETLTYGEVAKLSGSPGAARAVGSILKKNTDSNTPCHRVIRSDGKLGKYNNLRGDSKERILKMEGYKNS